MKINVVGMDPDLAVTYAVSQFDQEDTADKKVDVLLKNRPVPPTKADELPKNITSGNTIDIYVGELLGLGVAGAYYNWLGERMGKTYQVVVGVEDGAKSNIENYLSDGGIWDNQTKEKMLYQQVAVQGYFPKAVINNEHVARIIQDKIDKRSRYPENCGLIVNIYSESGDLNFQEIIKHCDISGFDTVLVIWYNLPTLDIAKVFSLSAANSSAQFAMNTLTVKLSRFTLEDKWEFNYDDARHYSSKRDKK